MTIDKQSSAELSEAINSMYRWYENATLCYVHLADVDGVEHDDMESFRRSRYWTRGWTLQELIAPRILIFFSSGWTRIGTRLDVREVVAEATNIPKAVLRFRSMRDYSVSQKMSWASRRQTTRLEDEAYCLLGLFGVSMPLLYGEGRRAFRRLQEEIIKELDDESIFAWQGGTDHGLLASCPAQFAFSHSIQRSIERPISDTSGDPPFAITNRGIRISLPVLENCHTVPLYSLTRSSQQYLVPNPLHLQGGVQDRVLAILNCQQSTDSECRVAVVLNYDDSRGRFTRDVNIGLVKVSTNEIAKQATLKQLLVAAGGKSPWDDTVMDDDPGRLVVIQGLPEIIAHFKFERATLLSGRELDYDVQENGTISVRFFQRRGIVAIYHSQASPEHHYIVIYLKPSDAETKIDAAITHLYGQDINKETIISRITQAGQHYLSGRYKYGAVYETPDGIYSLSPRIREAEHASVVEVAIESQERLGVSPGSARWWRASPGFAGSRGSIGL